MNRKIRSSPIRERLANRHTTSKTTYKEEHFTSRNHSVLQYVESNRKCFEKKITGSQIYLEFLVGSRFRSEKGTTLISEAFPRHG